MSTAHNAIGIVLIGLGPIGRRVAVDISERPGFNLAAAIDHDPLLFGQPLTQFVPEAPKGLVISGSLNDVENLEQATVAIVCTSSKLETVAPVVLACLEAGLHVVSSCEALLYPWNRAPTLSAELDRAAKSAHRSVLGTGINPGFLMDYLPSVLTGLCRQVESIEVERIQDAMPRRRPFQLKIGAGLSLEAFEERTADGSIGHQGLPESVELLAASLNIKLDEVTETIKPVLSTEDFQVNGIEIRAGGVCGIEQVGLGQVNGQPKLTLRFIAALNQKEPRERIMIHGQPGFEMVIPGGVHGDIATSAVLLNVLTPVIASKPGLQTMNTIAATTWR